MRSLLFAGALIVLSFAACSKQGLGDRCDKNAEVPPGESDCESGLVCTSKADLQEQSDRCCPADPNNPQVPICSRNKGSGSTDSGIPEAGNDTGSDAGDGGNDASDASDGSDDASDAAEGG